MGGTLFRTPPEGPGASRSPLPQHPEGGTCMDDSGCRPGKAERKAQGKVGLLLTPSTAAVNPRLLLPGSPSCSLPSCHPDLGLPRPRPSHISVLRPLLLGVLSLGDPKGGTGGPPLHTHLGWTLMDSSLAPGIRTGKCVAFNNTVQTCEIFGWCPVEVDDNIPR